MTARSIGSLAGEVVNDLSEKTGRVRQFPDEWQHWRDNLAGKPGLVHDGQPECGFYRRRYAWHGPFVPAAIFRDDAGTIVCLVDGRRRDPEPEWSHLYANPISEEEYRRVAEQGLPWSDIDPSVAAALSPSSPGDNQPSDEAEILADQIESSKAAVKDYAQITSDDQARRAQSLRSRLLELARNADAKRRKEKAPHFDRAKAVDGKWMPWIQTAQRDAELLRYALSHWETQKARTASPSPPSTIKGAYGRAASVRMVKVATVINQDETYVFVRLQPDVVSAIAKAAQRLVDAGFIVPGVEAKEEAAVR